MHPLVSLPLPPLRWLAISLFIALITPATWAAPAQGLPDVFEEVTERARQLAASPYEESGGDLPQALRDIDYDAYRAIRFRPEAALWKDETLFSVQLFHTGFLFERPVRLHLVENGEQRDLPFQSSFFHYDGSAAPLKNEDLSGAGYAGFRLHFPLNREDYHDEFLLFQGASYFRVVGRDQGYGLSARGLAIDTAASRGEEFPAFTAFWLMKPDPDATRIDIVALLDSPSLAGAYHFRVHTGEQIDIETEARLFARRDVAKLGIAPLTSMFMHGDVSPYPADDFRPQVHDSQGLLMQTHAGEWIWRPLNNPGELRITRLQDANPSGFGLAQRDRDFDRYLDMESRYERRPSYWIAPLGDWGPGSVELVEIPSESETNDNIAAYWLPEQMLEAGGSRTYRYRLSTFDAERPEQRLASTVRTRQGWGAVPGQNDPPPRSRRQFVVDFRGGELSSLDASHPVDAELVVSSGEARELQVRRLPDGQTWRASFRIQPEGRIPMDMRLRLMLRDAPMSETWNYVWNPDELR
ncbi:glucan biosynthesis protein [Halomonas lysinitropha]|uniref:Glucans biosynthesis protein G n=1 Tax=Halomonas lysinitropha TaxID=2607506 RepID=A0A5K1I999_9GAMM|nr:glucan biosynthesis protein G [Halomonas lysinitropha]VVZ96857.1 Glucans biosynthesis protein G precursor [Halomonas lysinitropha]